MWPCRWIRVLQYGFSLHAVILQRQSPIIWIVNVGQSFPDINSAVSWKQCKYWFICTNDIAPLLRSPGFINWATLSLSVQHFLSNQEFGDGIFFINKFLVEFHYYCLLLIRFWNTVFTSVVLFAAIGLEFFIATLSNALRSLCLQNTFTSTLTGIHLIKMCLKIRNLNVIV